MIETPKGFLELTPYSDRIVRVRYGLTGEFSTKPSLMIQQLPKVTVAIDVREAADYLLFSTSKLSIRINRETGAFTYLDRSGEILTKEPDRGGKTLIPIDVAKSVFSETDAIQIRKDADGVRAFAPSVKQIVDRQAFH